MGLFEKKECVNCGKMCGVFGRSKTKDKKILCSECAGKVENSVFVSDFTYDQYPALVERCNENDKRLQEFNIDKVYYDRIVIDETNNWIAVFDDEVYKVKKKDLLEEKPHIYDAKDLKFFLQKYDIKKEEKALFGADIYIDFHTTMVFEDEFVPCPLNGVVESNRKIEVTGVFKKTVENFYKPHDLELYKFATEILKEKGLERPVEMQKGDTIESLDKYAPWFKVLFELEKKEIIDDGQVSNILDGITENMGIFGGTKMSSQIRKRFGA